ncbi:MAG: 2-vinyl bacteriochlorophyllide hydratase [Acidocella sp.]|nr:2-vinyl bacteriochlorophyllide hydratase [Acidocella sp.]
MFTQIFDRLIDSIDCCPWTGNGRGLQVSKVTTKKARPPYLYSPAERRRRDASHWTLVQGILAPVQFLVFLTSLSLVVHYLITGNGLEAATISVLIKTGCLYTIMITGAIWEYEVFGQYLFAPAFFWEDVFSFLVIGLHTAYVVVLLSGAATPHTQMLIALAAYVSYCINAMQFVMKLRAARLERPRNNAVGQMG